MFVIQPHNYSFVLWFCLESVFTLQLNWSRLAAQRVAARTGEDLEDQVTNVVVPNFQLRGVAADLVCGPVGDGPAVVGPWHHSLRGRLSHTQNTDHHFAVQVNSGSYFWQKCFGITWKTKITAQFGSAIVNTLLSINTFYNCVKKKRKITYVLWCCRYFAGLGGLLDSWQFSH